MCLIVLAWKLLPACPLIMAANRDEFFNRPSKAASWWDDNPDVFAGRDLQAGGTWLGVNRQGRFAALTNIRNGQPSRADVRTRGELVAGFLNSEHDIENYLAQVQNTAGQYNGFNLLVGDGEQAFWFSNENASAAVKLEPGIYGLSNGSLDSPWPKVVRAKAQFASLLCQSAPDEAYFEMLADTTPAADHRLPDTGVSIEWERLLSPICIESPDYGTRASTLVKLHDTGNVQLLERVIR
jgi:uncharacterized protein with NRDE domain